MSNIDKVQFGDVIAVHSYTFLGKAIRFFMRKYKPQYKTYNHNAVVINIWGEKWVAEALAWGVRLHKFECTEYNQTNNWDILRHKLGFTDKQIEAMSKKCASLAGIRYQYENLPMWVLKILFKFNLFKKQDERAIYCSELAAIAINEAYPNSFKTPNITSPADHIASGYYDVIKL